MARSRIRGIGRFRRLLRRMPDSVRGELVVELNVTGRQIKQAIQAKAPSKTGAVRGDISYKVLPKSLRLQVGLFGRRGGKRNLFYGRIQDLGRREQVVQVQRRIARSSKLTKVYPMKVRGMTAKRFITGRVTELRRTLNDNLRGIFTRALQRIAGGTDE